MKRACDRALGTERPPASAYPASLNLRPVAEWAAAECADVKKELAQAQFFPG
ncbi:hypothetical protein CGLO_07450 [Colletotrichum gloeosporioides Cg-14]|uniref:Uncharacterized protein n=1 Tax=Colletotrichum gloeosporioides (strain Cg-14) TaxID=1237896 RepID=T0KBW6_COLGC|nr:hypothetical protein CGLO_07450 [Colletotrichum gloeosporioides Cg-14]